MSKWLRSITDPEERARVIEERKSRKQKRDREFHAHNREQRNAQRRARAKAMRDAKPKPAPKPKIPYQQKNEAMFRVAQERKAAERAARKAPQAKAESVAEFLAAGGKITRCPTKFVAPTLSAVDDETAAKRLSRMKVIDHAADSWMGQKRPPA